MEIHTERDMIPKGKVLSFIYKNVANITKACKLQVFIFQ